MERLAERGEGLPRYELTEPAQRVGLLGVPIELKLAEERVRTCNEVVVVLGDSKGAHCGRQGTVASLRSERSGTGRSLAEKGL